VLLIGFLSTFPQTHLAFHLVTSAHSRPSCNLEHNVFARLVIPIEPIASISRCLLAAVSSYLTQIPSTSTRDSSDDDGWPNDPDPLTDESDALTENSGSIIDDLDGNSDLGYDVPKWCTVNTSASISETSDNAEVVGVKDGASKFRDVILDNATKIIKALPKKRAVRRSTGTTCRKRSASADFNPPEPGQDGDGQPTLTTAGPPAKKPRTTKAAAVAPLLNTSKSN
jgi:hypothetical protein